MDSIRNRLSETWKEQFRDLTPLDRAGLMRIPQLSEKYVVALNAD